MPMTASPGRLTPSRIPDYMIAVLAVAAAVMIDVSFNRLVGTNPSVSLLLCAVVFVAWAGGTGPALLATALAALAFDYLLLQPVYSLALQFNDIPQLLLFVVAALFVVSLGAAQRRENLERRRAEERAGRAERELRLLVDTIPVLAVRYHPDGFMDFRNKTWRDYTGLSQVNVEGQRWGGALHPDDVEMVEREWRTHSAQGEPFELEQRMRRADGQYRWHWCRRVPLRDEAGEVVNWYGVAFDIDDRKRAETALRQSEAELARARHELQLIIDNIPVLVLRHRADGVIDYVNQVGRDYSGLTGTNWTRRTSVITHPDDVARLEEAWDVALATGRPFETEARLRRADGEYRWFTTLRVPLRNAIGEVIAWYGAALDIEDRKRAEDALRRSEAALLQTRHELQLTIDTIPALVVRHGADGIIDFVNETWRRYTGLSQAAWKGRGSVVVHPDDLARIEHIWLSHLETGEAFETEQRLRNADGEFRWHFVRRVPLRNDSGEVIAWYGAAHDIEDRKQAETALQRSQAYSAEAQKLSQTGSFAWEVATRDYFWSDQAYQILGFDRSVTPRISLVVQRTHPDDRHIIERELERSAQGAPYHDFQVRLLMPDGHIKHVHLLAHRIVYQSGNEEIVGAIRDITEARRSQETLQATQAALAHASRVATLGEISASIAHEVNQPLAAIVANGQACLRFLRRDPPDLNDVRGAVEWIVKDGNRAGEVIRRVRGLLKKAEAEKLPLDVNDTIDEVAALLRAELAAQEVTLRLELAPEIPPTIADRIQLQQVIINLVMNGAEAMQAIADRPRALAVHTHLDEADRIAVAVKDSGTGIPAETADRLFDAFFSTKPTGLGIGLSICRSIIADHGGRLWASNNDEEPGATFRFTLPAYQAGAIEAETGKATRNFV